MLMRFIIFVINQLISVMSEEVWKFLPHVPQVNKKPNILKRKSQVTDKEVLNLTGGLFPLKLIDTHKHEMDHNDNASHWIYTPILQKNQKIGPIYHWVNEGEEKKLYHGEKFNIQTDVIAFSEQEFDDLNLKIENLTYGMVCELFESLKTYNLNFIVVKDRITDSEWTIQDLKEIYFTITREILQRRNKKEHPLANYIFDKKYESNRKYELEKYMMRYKVDTDKEKNLIAEIRRLEILIKKEEREQINLKRALKLDEVPEEVFQLESQVNLQEIRKNQRVYTRQQYLSKPLNLPGKTNERLVEVLHGMNIPDKITASEENAQLYDKLRQKILLMFSIQRYIRKKETERRVLEEKKKKLVSQEEEEKNKSSLKMPDGRPNKKPHLIKS